MKKKRDEMANRILAGTRFQGDMEVKGECFINGEIQGNITMDGQLELGPLALVQGDITATSALIAGNIRGNINITGALTIKRTAKINGNIITQNLQIECGGIFNGNCSTHNGQSQILISDDEYHIMNEDINYLAKVV